MPALDDQPVGGFFHRELSCAGKNFLQCAVVTGIEVLQKAVDADPNVLTIRYHLAQALAKSGDKAHAITHLERIVAAGAKFSQEAEALALLSQLKN